jgi:TonB-dependent starch-binding outer membrane protein SusC
MHLTTVLNAFERSVLPSRLETKKLLRIMRFTAIFLLTACLAASANGFTQTVSLSVKNSSLEQVFPEIERQTGYYFVYTREEITRGIPVTIQVKNAKLEDVLALCFKNQPFGFTITNNVISVTPKSRKASDNIGSVLQVTPPPITVKGRIVNENGEPVVANVMIKGSQRGTSTNEEGYFELRDVDEEAILVITAIGVVPTEIKVNGRQNIDIRVKIEALQSQEVVVKGYYSSTRKASTGSVSTVRSEKIMNQPVSDPIAALQGRSSGLMITSSNGMPGSAFQVRIRGENSMSNGNEPLYVVDGVPFIFPATLNQFSGANGNQSPLSSINPGDIERIDVLKDADATAIYGSRGANGVILITTNKGVSGATRVNFNVYTGISRVGHKLDLLNTEQYLALRNEAFANDAAVKTTANAPDLLVWDQNAYTDWQDLLIGNTAPVTQAQVSISGGSAQTKFLVTGAVHKEGTVLLGDFGYTRGSSHLSFDHSSANRKFGITASVNFSGDKNDIVPTDVSQYFNLPPNLPVYNPDGSLYWYGSTQNPVAYLNRTYETNTYNLIGNSTLRYEIVPGLTARANLGYTMTTMKQLQTLPATGFTTNSPVPGSTAQYGHSDANSYVVESQLDYTRQTGPGKLSLMAGGTWQQTVQEGYYYLGAGYSSDALLKNMAAASTLTLRNFNYSEYKYQAFYGRINYDVDSKYILNLTFRRDGSSRFGDGNRFGNFGAAGVAWVFSDERFLKQGLSFISLGKLRLSYGVTGNDQIGDYRYLDSWTPSSFPYAGLSGLVPERAYNPEFSWETNKKLDVSLDLGFLRNRISLTTSYYNNRSDDQLVGQTLSPQSGFTSYTSNFPALVENKGWEFDLLTRNIDGPKFSWITSLNLTLPKNTLLRYDNLATSGDAAAYEVGKSTRIIKGYKFVGVNPSTGIAEFLDVNKDNQLNQAGDWVIMGETLPKMFGGLSNEFRYKNLSLDVFFQFVKQEAPTIDWGPLAGAYGGMSNKATIVLDRWQKPGDITNIPRATVTSSNPANTAFRNYYRTSDAVWGDASYARLKNLSLKYDLSSITKRWKIISSSIYVQGQNLFTITNYIGLDPEINGFDRRFVFPINPFGSVRAPAMPVLRTITIGLNITI